MKRREFLLSASKSAMLTKLAAPLAIAEGVVPANGSSRLRLSMDSNWLFHRGDANGAESPAFDDKAWTPVDVPHDWSILGPFAMDNPGGHRIGYLPTGIGWYRKALHVPQAGTRQARVEFDGVYMNSDVWINGHHLGRRPYGYSSFEYDLTPHLRTDGKPDILAVRVDNSQQPNSRYYTGSGIYRHVWLNIAGPVCVEHWGTAVTTQSVKGTNAAVRVAVQLRNTHAEKGTVLVRNTVFDDAGRSVAHAESKCDLAGTAQTVQQEIPIANAKLWSVEEPNMYVARTTLYRDGKLIDSYDTPFGIRTFHFDADRGFFLNGKNVKLKGVNMHHDLGALGAAFSRAAAERRLHLLKAAGCNGIRMAHNPPAPQLLDLCDRMGFLVIDEAFDIWSAPKQGVDFGYNLYFKEWAERDLRDMILRDRNHPSIILWSIGNEIPDKGKPNGVADCKFLAKITRDTDPTRPVTAGCNFITHANASGFAEVLDVVGYNGGGGSSNYYDSDHAKYPARKMYGSEVPHTAQTRGVYISTPEHCSSFPEAFVEMNYEQSWRKTKDRPFFAGEFRWISFDYLGEPTRHIAFHIPALKQDARWPLRSSEAGIIDMCGLPKDAYFFYQSQWSQKPMVHLLPHWTWPEKTGRVIRVWSFTNCDAVELFLNDRSVGRKTMTSNGPLHLEWEVNYAPGTLRAIGFRGGKEVCNTEVKTAGKPAKIALRVERVSITADGKDVVYLQAAVTDEAGIMAPDANHRIHFSVQGAGRLVAVDNGDTMSHESFQGSSIAAFSGMCIAVVRASRSAGEIHVQASAEGLQSGSAMVSARPAKRTSKPHSAPQEAHL
ncbi:MAG: glycoside hydrolase family 2 protein [Acidobacteria bacterium]|nr:glycoside hydrolase family 2 protein [Acidobacteriota bacterium]